MEAQLQGTRLTCVSLSSEGSRGLLEGPADTSVHFPTHNAEAETGSP